MPDQKEIKEYSNGEITVKWQATLCSHSTKCWKELGSVFRPRDRPWVNMEGASTDDIIAQVLRCPSGALSVMDHRSKPDTSPVDRKLAVEIVPHGPLILYGDVMVKDADGLLTAKNGKSAFCRCGASANKPYCDGSHREVNFDR